MLGMLLGSALLTFQLDKIYAQSTDPNSPPDNITVDISLSPSCTGDQDHIDCLASDDGATLTGLDPPFDSDFDLDCEIHSLGESIFIAPGVTIQPPLSYSCNLDFRSPELGDSNWDANVFCFGGLNHCSGTLDDENHN
jgi:hypothetical protein